MLPEGCNERFAALRALELGAREGAEFGKVFRTKVWHLMLLPMGPQVLDGIELWRVSRQEFKLYVASFGPRRNRAPGGCDGLADDPK